MKLSPVAIFHGPFREKFGIPRQSGLADTLEGTVVLEKAFASPEALRGLEVFGRIWLIWGFSANRQEGWSPTVRPPRLGGNKRIGVFATRSPYRPNAIGLSCVRLEAIREGDGGLELVVSGADLMDGTPILDIKPYLPYADSRPEARSGFAGDGPPRLTVCFPPETRQGLAEEDQQAIEELLAGDPRPAYQHDPDRIYGMSYHGLQVRFRVDGDRLTVVETARDDAP